MKKFISNSGTYSSVKSLYVGYNCFITNLVSTNLPSIQQVTDNIISVNGSIGHVLSK